MKHAHTDSGAHAGKPLSREDLVQGSMRDAYLKSELADLAWSDLQLRRSLHRTLRDGGQTLGRHAVWVLPTDR